MIWLLVQAVAITIVASQGQIFERLRDFGPEEPGWLLGLWREGSNCPLCVGVWVGGGLAALEPGTWSLIRGLETLGFGCTAGVVALLVVKAIEALSAHANCREQE